MSGLGAEARTVPPPRLLTWAERIVATASTPGTLLAASATPPGIGDGVLHSHDDE